MPKDAATDNQLVINQRVELRGGSREPTTRLMIEWTRFGPVRNCTKFYGKGCEQNAGCTKRLKFMRCVNGHRANVYIKANRVGLVAIRCRLYIVASLSLVQVVTVFEFVSGTIIKA